jgi:hypothetical protein
MCGKFKVKWSIGGKNYERTFHYGSDACEFINKLVNKNATSIKIYKNGKRW